MPLLRNNPDLLRAFRAGDCTALEAVYRYHVRSIDMYFRALARGANAPELSQATAVQDLIQDTFIRAFSAVARARYDSERDFGPYLKAMARNCFIDALRKRRREIPLDEDGAPLLLEKPGSDDQDYDPRVLLALETYLKDLGPELRGVYEQRFVLGLSQESACEQLGLSRRSLRTLEDHLRRGLRKSLLLAGLLDEGSFFSVRAVPASGE